MLIQGGMMTSGLAWTFSVSGAYWMSWMRSFSKTTDPGETAVLRPTSKASMSVWRIRSLPLPRSRSASIILRPRTRLSPFCSTVASSTSGFSAKKLAGFIASTNCRV